MKTPKIPGTTAILQSIGGISITSGALAPANNKQQVEACTLWSYFAELFAQYKIKRFRAGFVPIMGPGHASSIGNYYCSYYFGSEDTEVDFTSFSTFLASPTSGFYTPGWSPRWGPWIKNPDPSWEPAEADVPEDDDENTVTMRYGYADGNGSVTIGYHVYQFEVQFKN